MNDFAESLDNFNKVYDEQSRQKERALEENFVWKFFSEKLIIQEISTTLL